MEVFVSCSACCLSYKLSERRRMNRGSVHGFGSPPTRCPRVAHTLPELACDPLTLFFNGLGMEERPCRRRCQNQISMFFHFSSANRHHRSPSKSGQRGSSGRPKYLFTRCDMQNNQLCVVASGAASIPRATTSSRSARQCSPPVPRLNWSAHLIT